MYEVPTPAHPARPFPFLKVEMAWRCTFGEKQGCNVIVRESYKYAHYNEKHPHARNKCYDKIWVQTFSAHPCNDFEVQPRAGTERDTYELPVLPTETNPELLSGALRQQWKPLPPPVGTTSDDYHVTSPFLVQTGLARFIEGWNSEKLELMLSLIEPPGVDDNLRHVVEAARRIFADQQKSLWDIAVSLRTLVMCDKK